MSKQAKKEAWVNYGDATPLQHGGLWIKKDTDNDTCYYVVKVDIDQDKENNWLYSEGYIDISESWINWESVKNSCDMVETDIDKVISLVWYYGLENFGGSADWIEGRKAIRKLINNNGIVIHRKEVC